MWLLFNKISEIHSRCYNLHSHQQCTRVISCFISLATFVLSISNFGHCCRGVMVSHCDLSLMSNNIEQLYLLISWLYPYFVKNLLTFLLILKIRLAFSFLICKLLMNSGYKSTRFIYCECILIVCNLPFLFLNDVLINRNSEFYIA